MEVLAGSHAERAQATPSRGWWLVQYRQVMSASGRHPRRSCDASSRDGWAGRSGMSCVHGRTREPWLSAGLTPTRLSQGPTTQSPSTRDMASVIMPTDLPRLMTYALGQRSLTVQRYAGLSARCGPRTQYLRGRQSLGRSHRDAGRRIRRRHDRQARRPGWRRPPSHRRRTLRQDWSSYVFSARRVYAASAARAPR